jgi:hypothetical protein
MDLDSSPANLTNDVRDQMPNDNKLMLEVHECGSVNGPLIAQIP